MTKKIANGGVVTIVVTTLLSAFVWFFPVYLFPAEFRSEPVPFEVMGVAVFAIPALISKVIAFVFWLVVWYKINEECEKVHIIPMRSVMPFVIGIAVVTGISELQFFHSGMVAFVFFVVALMTIFDLYKVSNQVNESFKVVLLILISSLFVPEYIWMLMLFFLGLAVYKVRSMRIFFSVTVAMLVFVWMVWGICFSMGRTELFTSYLLSLVDFGFSGLHGSLVHIAGLSLMFIAMLIVMIAMVGISHKFDARTRLNGSFINSSFLISVALTVIAKGFNMDLMMIAVLMVTLLSALYYSTQRNNFANILFLVSMVLLLAYRVADEFIKIEI